jgi:hypothetical protein
MDEQPKIRVEDQVRLMKSIPELMLHRGDIGVVCSIWHAGESAYEVEFPAPGSPYGTRTVLFEEQVEEVEPRKTIPPVMQA